MNRVLCIGRYVLNLLHGFHCLIPHTRWRICNLACRFAYSLTEILLFRLNGFTACTFTVSRGRSRPLGSLRGTALCRTLSHSDSCRKRQCLSHSTRDRPARPVCHGSTDTTRALITQADHAEQLVALHVHARKHNYLQQHDHHERLAVSNRVCQRGQHQHKRGQQRCSDAQHDCVKQRNHRSPARAGKRRNHTDQQAHRQEHRADDKQNLRQQHTACQHNRKRRHNQVENQKEHG